MTNQVARDARDAGIGAAAANADRINPEWRDLAYTALVDYAQRNPVFTIEQLRASLGDTLEDPPSLRAWGGIAQRAVRAGIVVHHGWRESENPACHCGEVRVWRSTKFAAEPHRTPFRLVDQKPSDEHGDTVNAGVSVAYVKDLESRLGVATTALRHVYQTLLLIDPAAPWRVANQSVFAACRDGIAHAEKCDPDIVQDVAEEAAHQRRYERDVIPPPALRHVNYLATEFLSALDAFHAAAEAGSPNLFAGLLPQTSPIRKRLLDARIALGVALARSAREGSRHA